MCICNEKRTVAGCCSSDVQQRNLQNLCRNASPLVALSISLPTDERELAPPVLQRDLLLAAYGHQGR